MKPWLLDLYCGAGGAAMGYHRAGFEVVGVDIKRQPNYPFEFVQMDALDALIRGYWSFDAIHASPPCQAYIRGGNASGDGRHPDLLPETREVLEATGLPWVIENVPGAPMRPEVMLCGSMFGLEVQRHRWFEFSWAETLMAPASCDHSYPVAGVYGNPHGQAGAWPGMLPSDLPTWRRAMGIDWMTAKEIKDAIPPAYTEWIGRRLMAVAMSTRDASETQSA